MNKIPNKISIKKRELPGCAVCGSKDTQFAVTYIDVHNRIERNGQFYANMLKYSCPAHVAEVTAIVLQGCNLLPKDPLYDEIFSGVQNTAPEGAEQ